MADDGANNWLDNPIIKKWADEGKRKGGIVLLTGYPYAPYKGAPCIKYAALSAQVVGQAQFPYTYELAPVGVRAAVGFEKFQDNSAIGAGKVVESIEDTAKALGLDKGLAGVASKALGIPLWLVITTVAVGGLVATYALLVNIGVAPPLNKLKGGE